MIDYCNELFMFRTIAEKTGTDLTNANWTKTVDSFGKIDLVSTDIASLCKGKYDADDAFRLRRVRPRERADRRLETDHPGAGCERREVQGQRPRPTPDALTIGARARSCRTSGPQLLRPKDRKRPDEPFM